MQVDKVTIFGKMDANRMSLGTDRYKFWCFDYQDASHKFMPNVYCTPSSMATYLFSSINKVI